MKFLNFVKHLQVPYRQMSDQTYKYELTHPEKKENLHFMRAPNLKRAITVRSPLLWSAAKSLNHN
jgi:hypothetical protein